MTHPERPGRLDAEVKILDDMANGLDSGSSGMVTLFVDRAVCSNCGAAILEIRRFFPKIDLIVIEYGNLVAS